MSLYDTTKIARIGSTLVPRWDGSIENFEEWKKAMSTALSMLDADGTHDGILFSCLGYLRAHPSRFPHTEIPGDGGVVILETEEAGVERIRQHAIEHPGTPEPPTPAQLLKTFRSVQATLVPEFQDKLIRDHARGDPLGNPYILFERIEEHVAGGAKPIQRLQKRAAQQELHDLSWPTTGDPLKQLEVFFTALDTCKRKLRRYNAEPPEDDIIGLVLTALPDEWLAANPELAEKTSLLDVRAVLALRAHKKSLTQKTTNAYSTRWQAGGGAGGDDGSNVSGAKRGCDHHDKAGGRHSTHATTECKALIAAHGSPPQGMTRHCEHHGWNRSHGTKTCKHLKKDQRPQRDLNQSRSKECFGCGEKGHFIKDCPDNPKNKKKTYSVQTSGGDTAAEGSPAATNPGFLGKTPEGEDMYRCVMDKATGTFKSFPSRMTCPPNMAVFNTTSTDQHLVLVDSCSDVSIENDLSKYTKYIPLLTPLFAHGIGGGETKFIGCGNAPVQVMTDKGPRQIERLAYHSTSTTDPSLISIYDLNKNSITATFSPREYTEPRRLDLKFADGAIATMYPTGLLYGIPKHVTIMNMETTATSTTTAINLDATAVPGYVTVKHETPQDAANNLRGRLGNLNDVDMLRLAKRLGHKLSAKDLAHFNEHGAVAKMKVVKKNKHRRQPTAEFGELTHSDSLGVFPKSLQNNRHAMIYIDDNSRMPVIVPIKSLNSDESLSAFKEYVINYQIPIQTESTLVQHNVRFHSDGGIEYMGRFKEALKQWGIRQTHSSRYRPDLNGIAERNVSMVMALMRVNLMVAKTQLKKYGYDLHSVWDCALEYACLQRSLHPTQFHKDGRTPFEVHYGTTLTWADINRMLPCPFGATVVVHQPKRAKSTYFGTGHGKADPHRGFLGLFMGFDTNERQYKALIPGHGFIKSTDMKFDNTSNLDVVPLLPVIPSDFEFEPVPNNGGNPVVVHDDHDDSQQEQQQQHTDDEEVNALVDGILEADDAPAEPNMQNIEAPDANDLALPIFNEHGQLQQDENDDNGMDQPAGDCVDEQGQDDTGHDEEQGDNDNDEDQAIDEDDDPLSDPEDEQPSNDTTEDQVTFEESADPFTESEPEGPETDDELPADPGGDSSNDELPMGPSGRPFPNNVVEWDPQELPDTTTVDGDEITIGKDYMVNATTLQDTLVYPTETDGKRINTPTTLKQAQESEHWPLWKRAIEICLGEHKTMGSFKTLGILQAKLRYGKSKRILRSKFVFAIKRDNASGRITKFRARLVVFGFQQEQDIDYEATFSAVPRHSTWKTLATISCHFKWHILQYDISSAFLHANLDRIVLSHYPKGYEQYSRTGELELMELLKCVNGVVQGPRDWSADWKDTMMLKIPAAWNEGRDTLLQGVTVHQFESDPCCYKFTFTNGECFFVLGWVDDVLTFGPDHLQQAFATELKKIYRTTGGKTIKQWLNANFDYNIDTGTLEIDQHELYDSYIEACGLTLDSNPVTTPLEFGFNINVDDHEGDKVSVQSASAKNYRTCIGKLLYIANFTAPELSIAASLLSRHIKNPPPQAIVAVKRIGRYLIHRKQYPYVIRRNTANTLNSDVPHTGTRDLNNCLTGASDATYNSFPDGTFTYGFVIQVLGNTVAYKSKKATLQGLSTFECETIGLSECTRELLYFRNFLEELGFPQQQPTTIYGDNAAAILHAKDKKLTERSKHLRLRHWHCRSCTARGWIQPTHMAGRSLVADALTKPLKRFDFTRHRHTLIGTRK